MIKPRPNILKTISIVYNARNMSSKITVIPYSVALGSSIAKVTLFAAITMIEITSNGRDVITRVDIVLISILIFYKAFHSVARGPLISSNLSSGVLSTTIKKELSFFISS